jgi:uncharacterized protein YdaU (DUF1376 family)
MHYYQFNIGDYASHTRHLDLYEDLAYRRLLDMYYLHERPLNVDSAVVAKQIGMREKVQVVQDVLNEFFQLGEDGWINDRADKEIKHFHSKIEQASRAGKASAERRSNARSTDVQPTNKQEPITINQEPSIEAKASPDLGKPKSVPPAPIQEIVEMFNKLLPMLPAVTVVNDSRKRAIAARWREVVTTDKMNRQQGLEFFEWYFNMVKDSNFLTGKSKDWKADLDFLFNASKFPRIIEGTYHKDQK